MRASRLLAILILLQLRGRQTAEALAREFEVSERTIYRDIDALSMAGVPVYGDRGPGGGFELLDGYRTRLTGLAPDEIEAMLLIGLPQAAQDMGLGKAAGSARNKLLASLPGADGNRASLISGRFHLDTADWYRALRPVPFLARIARAVLDRRLIAMTYTSWTATREWRIEPLGLVLKAGNWYLVGKGKDKVRTFNVADIQECDCEEASLPEPEAFDLADWWNRHIAAFEERLRPGRVRLRASPTGLQRLRMLGSFAGEAINAAGPPDGNGWRELALPVETEGSAAPMLLGIGPEIEILDPPQMRAAVAELARAVIERMEETNQ